MKFNMNYQITDATLLYRRQAIYAMIRENLQLVTDEPSEFEK